MSEVAHSAVSTLTLPRVPVCENHFRVFDSDRYVDHTYQADCERWFWGIAHDVTAPDVPQYGWHEPSREAAMESIKAAYHSIPKRPE
jgi:hypothetical protein